MITIRNIFFYLGIMSMVFMSCSSKNNPDADDFINPIDSMTLEEAIDYLKTLHLGYQLNGQMSKAFFADDPDDFKLYTKDEEEYIDLPNFKPAETLFNDYGLYLNSLYVEQYYTSPQTQLKLKVENFIRLPQEPEAKLKAIYFYNGTVDNTINEQLVEGEAVKLNTTKVIDSVLVDVMYTYYTDYDKHHIEKGTLNLPNGGSIEVVETKNNVVKLRLTGSASNFTEVVALSADGKPLAFLSSRTTSENIAEYANAFAKLVDKSVYFKSIDDVKKAMRRELGKLSPLSNRVYCGYYRGNVRSVYVYLPREDSKVSEKKELVLKNSKVINSNLILTFDEATNKWGFANRNGEFVIQPVYEDIEAINNCYYKLYDSNTSVANVYHLDTLKKTLVQLPLFNDYYSVSPYNIAVKSDKNNKYALWGAGGKPLTDYSYSVLFDIKGTDKLIGVLKRVVDKDDYITDLYGYINNLGEVVLPVNYTFIGNFNYGRALVLQNRVYAFINELGKVVVPLQQYSYVGELSDGLAVVKKNDLYGYIDVDGRIVIPLKYKDAYDFTNGIALVRNEDNETGLINKNDEVVVPFRDVNARVTSGSGYARTYTLDDKKYDAWGNEIPNEDKSDD